MLECTGLSILKACYSIKPVVNISLTIFFAKLSANTVLVIFAKPDAEVLASMMNALYFVSISNMVIEYPWFRL